MTVDFSLILRRQRFQLSSTRKREPQRHADTVDCLPRVDVVGLAHEAHAEARLPRLHQQRLRRASRHVKGKESVSHQSISLTAGIQRRHDVPVLVRKFVDRRAARRRKGTCHRSS